jgi:uncharacterized membrane protein YozB (DUF420 family)
MKLPLTLRFVKVAGWTVIVLSVMIMLASGIFRMVAMTQSPPAVDAFDVRYVQHMLVAFVHIVPGLLFLSLAPLQFIKRIRQRHLSFHRGLGRVLVICALISGVFALVVGFRLPVFGGISTQSATVFFGAIFLFSLVKAMWHIRRKEVRLHREWMIRAFALAMGVATIRVFLVPFMELGFSMEEVFGTTFWLGFSVNLLVAEVWINRTRGGDPRGRSTRYSPSPEHEGTRNTSRETLEKSAPRSRKRSSPSMHSGE